MRSRILLLLTFFFLLSCKSQVDTEHLSRVLGFEVKDVSLIKEYSSDGGMAEGVLFKMYKVSDSDTKRFLEQENKLLPDSGKLELTKKLDWVPLSEEIKKKYSEVFILIFNHYTGNDEIQTNLNNLEKRLMEDKTFCGFYYDDIYYTTKLEFYFFDVHKNNLYEIVIQV